MLCRRAIVPILALALTGCAIGVNPPVQTEIPLRSEPITFDLFTRTEHRLFIWDMHPIESVTLSRSLCDQLEVFGYHRRPTGMADFLVHAETFESDRSPRARVVVLECLDPIRLQQLWIGRAEVTEKYEEAALPGLIAAMCRDRRLGRFLAGS